MHVATSINSLIILSIFLFQKSYVLIGSLHASLVCNLRKSFLIASDFNFLSTVAAIFRYATFCDFTSNRKSFLYGERYCKNRFKQ
ncbi:hypothetical protein CW304_04035 [Bacillus sp. UFRGS-B20]|nr:hypothetical protein CW304_04035 [Bacillus sp. UFRGS-B20]